jgi:hypothetical protein
MFLNRKRRTLRSLSASAVTLAAAMAAVQPSFAQRHARKKQQIEESEQIKAVTGGITFQAALPFDRCFESAANALKRSGHEIQVASKDAGTIVTALEIAGRYTQTGTRYHFILIKDSDTQTSVRVAVTVQKRKKLLQTEPWGDPKIDDEQTAKAAADLEEALKG